MNWRRMNVPAVSLCVVLSLLVIGCGQRGDLYFPKETNSGVKTVATELMV